MTFDPVAFAKDLDLSADDQAVLTGLFTKSKKLPEAVMRQSEFDRRMNEGKVNLAAAEKALADKLAEVDSEYGALNAWRETNVGKFNETQEKLRQAEHEAFVLRQAVDRAAADAGKVVTDYLTDGKQKAAEPQKPAEPDDSGRFVDKDAFAKALVGNIQSQAELLELADEHRALFGTSLKPTEVVTEVFDQMKRGNTNVSLRQAWEGKFKVGEKRTELADASVAQRIKDAEEAAYVRGKSEGALGGSQNFENLQGPQSPVLREAAARTNAQHAGVSPGVTAAVAMHQGLVAKRQQQGQ